MNNNSQSMIRCEKMNKWYGGIHALKDVSDGVNLMKSKDRSFIIVTHYQRILNYIQPDFVHILVDGKIVKSGTKELALDIETNGYENIIAQIGK